MFARVCPWSSGGQWTTAKLAEDKEIIKEIIFWLYCVQIIDVQGRCWKIVEIGKNRKGKMARKKEGRNKRERKRRLEGDRKKI